MLFFSNMPHSYIINFYSLAKFSYLVYDFMILLSYHFFLDKVSVVMMH